MVHRRRRVPGASLISNHTPCQRRSTTRDFRGTLPLIYQVRTQISCSVSSAPVFNGVPGVELFANAVWYRSKATLKGVLTRMHSNTSTDSRKARFFPPEIVEMIINHLTYDIPTLKACAATCFTWYNVTLPHLHDTLILREWLLHPSKNVRKIHPNPLPALHQLGLLPLIKRLQFRGVMLMKYWVTPVVFDSRNMQYFRAMVNLQELRIADLDFSKFPAGFGEHLGHFSPTLRSIALDRPNGSRRQLLGFFMLFPALDDIEISSYYARQDWHEALASKITPIGGGLQGRLTLHTFAGEGLLKDMIVAFGGFRFTSMDLQNVQGMSLLLEACANTLETLRLHLDYRPRPCKRFFYSRG